MVNVLVNRCSWFLLHLTCSKISRAFRFCASRRSDRVLSILLNSYLDALFHFVTEVVGFSFLSSNVLKIWQTAVVIL